MKTIKDLLEEHPFFNGLTHAQLELLAGCGKNVSFKEGQLIAKQGEAADHFFVVRTGRVALDIDGVARGNIRVQTVEDGEIIGWSWLIPPHKWAYTIKAIDATHMIALDGRCLRGKCDNDHELGYELLKRFSTVLAKRLGTTRLQLLDVYGDHKR